MPQPVHHSKPISFGFSADAIMQRPELAIHIGEISALYNEIEARISILLAALLGTEAKTVISVFIALQNDGAKRAAIDAIVSLKLNEPDQKRFREILKNIGLRYSDRNKAIHGAWGVSPQYPEHLLWSDIRESTLLAVDLIRLSSPNDDKERQALLLSAQKAIMVYNKRDFIEIGDRLRAAYEELREFSAPFVTQAFGHSFVPSPTKPKLYR
jgi:hypothetical protein